MTWRTVVVGPATVRAPAPVDDDLSSVALACIDDPLAVYSDRVCTVRALWCDIMRAALTGAALDVTLVVPTRWPRARIELVEGALLETAANVRVRSRGGVLREFATGAIELGPECVVAQLPDDACVVLPRVDGSVADAVLDVVSGLPSVVIDVPSGAPGVTELADELASRLRVRDVEVSRVTDEDIRAMSERVPPVASVERSHGIDGRRVGVAAGVLLAAAGLAGAAAGAHSDGIGMTWVVEGRVALEVPADWMVERIVVGPGSARVQVVSPSDATLAVHMTQARVPPDETLRATALALGAALDAQPDGRFTDFVADGVVAGRPAVSYREVRPSFVVDWTVVVDDGVRIAIGCQRPSATKDWHEACERAIRSAHTTT